MKRPRENNYISEEIPIFSLSSILEGTTIPASTPVSSPRNWSSCHRRRSRRGSRRQILPNTLFVGSCFVAALALLSGITQFPTLPVANASIMTSTSGIASEMAGTDINIDIDINEKQFHEMLRGGRRIEQTSADDNENDSKQSSSSSLFSSTTVEECTVPAGTCMHCTFSEQKTYDVCLETGRWQKFECLLPSDSNTEDESQDTMYKWKSCKHTDLEGGLAMFRLQTFCLLIGVLSIMSVKKQKRFSSSMFDRRKQRGGAETNSNTNANSNSNTNAVRSNAMTGSNMVGRSRSTIADDEDEIEFTPMTNQQRERVPLVERLEII